MASSSPNPPPAISKQVTKKKTIKCDLCSKPLTWKSSLTQQIKMVHTGETKFRCTYCDKQFPTSAKLNAHVRIHTGEKPFTCDICNKSFTQEGTLRRHS